MTFRKPILTLKDILRKPIAGIDEIRRRDTMQVEEGTEAEQPLQTRRGPAKPASKGQS